MTALDAQQKPTVQVSNEAIVFQGGSFMTAIADLVDDTNFKSPTSIAEFEKKLIDLAAQRLNINITVEDSKGELFYIVIPWLSGNNATWPEYYKEFIDASDTIETVKKLKDRKAVVDLEHSKLSGIFESLTMVLCLDYNFMAKQVLTAQETAAIILHEFGHYFTACEMLDRTATNNLVLATVMKAVEGGDVKQREMTLEIAAKEYEMSNTVISDIKASTSVKAVSLVFLSAMMGKTRSANGNGYYDVTTMEFLCDQFAARHGAGRHLVVALDKIYKSFGVSVSRSRFWCVVIDIVKVCGTLLSLALGLLGLFGIAIDFVLGILITTISLCVLSYDGSDVIMPHNSNDQRSLRIRGDLVQALKAPNLSVEMTRQLVGDLKIIDELLKEYSGQYRTIIQRFFEFISSVRKSNLQTLKFQQEIEKLAQNDLFIAAADLKTT